MATLFQAKVKFKGFKGEGGKYYIITPRGEEVKTIENSIVKGKDGNWYLLNDGGWVMGPFTKEEATAKHHSICYTAEDAEREHRNHLSAEKQMRHYKETGKYLREKEES